MTGNGQTPVTPLNDDQVRIIQLEGRIVQLVDRCNELIRELQARDVAAQAVEQRTKDDAAKLAKLQGGLHTLVDFCKYSVAREHIVPEHLAHYANEAGKLLPPPPAGK